MSKYVIKTKKNKKDNFIYGCIKMKRNQ